MKLFEVSSRNFRDSVEKLVAQDWAQDPFMPTSSDGVYGLDDDEFDELQSFVDDVADYAVLHNITSPREAIDTVVDIIRGKHKPTTH